MKISFIGAGRVANAFSAYIKAFGIAVGIYDKNHIYTDYQTRTPNKQRLEAIFAASDIVFITTPDDTIREVAEMIAALETDIADTVVAHMSGSLGSDELQVLSCNCNGIFSLHPMMSILGQPIDFSKVYFTLEGSGDENMIGDMLRRIDAHYSRIESSSKALYHAASCFCANYSVTLMDMSRRLFEDIGISEEHAWQILMPLMRQVLCNVEQNGSQNALTGPVSRGDAGTLRKHLAAMDMRRGELAAVYRFMGKETAAFARRAGVIDDAKADAVIDAFS